MADNARLHDHEKLIAADEINDIKYLKVKLQYGEDDSAVSVSPTNPLPVAIGGDTITIENANLNFGVGMDAFGRLRVSNPFTLLDSSFRYRDNIYKWNHSIVNNSGSVAVSHLPNESSMSLTLGTSNGDSIIRETKRVFSYQSGKSLLIMNTFVFAEPKANLRQRVGYFGASDGVYFMAEGTNFYMVIRKSTSGVVNDTIEKIAQANWNVDTLDGSGNSNNPSGRSLVVTRPQIFFSDIEWLGVGTVRVGFVINGEFIVVHKFHHANVNGFDGVYMKTGSLPIRYEITNTGITTSSSSMKQICSTVISEGGYVNQSLSRSISNVITGKNLNQNVFNPLVSIRLKSTNLDAIVVPSDFETFGLQNTAFKWALILNPTLTNASWTDFDSDSSVEYDTSSTSLAGGSILTQGIFAGGVKGGGNLIGAAQLDFCYQLTRQLNGTADILCLAAYPTSNNDDAIGVLTWQEH